MTEPSTSTSGPGVKGDGTEASGAMTISHAGLAAIIEDRWASGWQSLTVTYEGAVVAGIEYRHGARLWWAER